MHGVCIAAGLVVFRMSFSLLWETCTINEEDKSGSDGWVYIIWNCVGVEGRGQGK